MSYSDQVALAVGVTWAVLGGAFVICFIGAAIVSWWQDREVA